MTLPNELRHVQIFNTCPQVQKLCPLPGQARRGSLGATTTQERVVDARQLDRVRALLAKAESTGFPEEAKAYTAKAQELMARYSIDYALLSAGTDSREEPVGLRIGVDNPYEAPKVLLLDAVARANRCRSVWSSALGFVTVLGFRSDVDAVEMLFTSLLVQGTGAMVNLVGKPVAVSNREGWVSGRAAADRANLNTRDAVTAET